MRENEGEKREREEREERGMPFLGVDTDHLSGVAGPAHRCARQIIFISEGAGRGQHTHIHTNKSLQHILSSSPP